MRRAPLLAALGAAILSLAPPGPAAARPLNVAVAVATQTMDPHGTTETNTLGVIMNVYEGLVRRGRDMAIEPALATRWELVEPTRWRFHLRPGVRFHDGTPLTVEDVAFSLRRAQSETSDARPAVRAVARLEPVDENTFDLVTAAPAPVLLSELGNFYVMSRRWTEANNAGQPFTPTRGLGVENFATRNANGTGPFRLRAYEAGQQVRLERNPDWWDRPANDVTEVAFTPIASDATRIAALLAGDVDLINPMPEQAAAQIAANPALRVIRGPRPAVMFLGMNGGGDRLRYGEAAGNPFRDVRVRRAVYAAIDDAALRRVAMRGAALPAGSMIPEGVEGFQSGMAAHPPADLAAARRLMAEAGYADGFAVTLDCTNDQYPGDETVCTALAPMLARIGIRVSPRPESRARFFPRITGGDTSLYLMAWYAPTFDAHHILWNTMQTKAGPNGSWNATGWSNPAFDALVDRIAVEMEPARRRDLIAEADRIERDDAVYAPLYQLTLAWAARANIDAVQRPDNRLDLRFVSVR